MTAAEIVTHLDHFQHRVVQEAMTDATAAFWRRRAAVFDWVRPRPGDHVGTRGQACADEIGKRAVASRDACLARAAVSIIGDAA